MKLIHADEITELDNETLEQLRNSAPHEIDTSKFLSSRLLSRDLELAYIAKLDQERAKAQHYYMTIKAIMFVLNTEGSSDAQKLQSIQATLTEQGF